MKIGETDAGWLGEVAKSVIDKYDIPCSVYVCELNLKNILPHVKRKRKFISLGRYPAIGRDISLIAPKEVRSGEIVALIKEMGGGLVEKVKLFDQYFGEQISHGFRGLAYTIQYRSKERTLTAEEVDQLHGKIRQALVDTLKVQIR